MAAPAVHLMNPVLQQQTEDAARAAIQLLEDRLGDTESTVAALAQAANWAPHKRLLGPIGEFVKRRPAFRTEVRINSAGRQQLWCRRAPPPGKPNPLGVVPVLEASPEAQEAAIRDVLAHCNAVEWTPVGVVSQKACWKANHKSALGPIGGFLKAHPLVFETSMIQDGDSARPQLVVRRAPEDPRLEYGRRVQQVVRKMIDENATEEEAFEWQTKYRGIVRQWWVEETYSDRVPLEDVKALTQQERMWIQAWAAHEGIAIQAADGAVCAVRQGTTADPAQWKDLGPAGRFARFGAKVVALARGDPPDGVLVFQEALSTNQILLLKALNDAGLHVHARPGWTAVVGTRPLTDADIALSTEISSEDMVTLGGVCRDVNESRRNNEDIFAARSGNRLAELIDAWAKCKKGLSFVNVANALHRSSEEYCESSLRYLAQQVHDQPKQVGTQESANLLQGLQRQGGSPGALAILAALAPKVAAAQETYTGRVNPEFIAQCIATGLSPEMRKHSADPAVCGFLSAVASRVRKCDSQLGDEHVGAALRMIACGEVEPTPGALEFKNAVLEKAPHLAGAAAAAPRLTEAPAGDGASPAKRRRIAVSAAE